MPPTNQQFITLNEKIISFDIRQLEILSFSVRHTEGRFLLRTDKLDFVYRIVGAFDLAICEGNPQDMSTWEKLVGLSRCILDIWADQKTHDRFFATVPLVLRDEPPPIYDLYGSFEKEERPSADCEVNS